MARQNRSAAKPAASTETPDTNTNTNEESTVTTETPEAPVAEATEAPAEVEINLDAFKEAVTAAVGEADTSTGELPASAIESVNVQYRKLEGQKPKNAARGYLEEQMLAAVGKLDAVAARSYSDLKANLSAAGGAKAEKAPADPTVAYVQRVAALRLALSIVESDAPEGEGLAEKIDAVVNENTELVSKQQAYLADTSEDKGDGPDLNPVVRAAFKAAQGKGTGGRTSTGGSTGPRHDTAKHIASAFAGVEVGTFLTIAEIAKHKSEEYGDDTPSQGAISARLFPTTTVAGVEPVEKGAIDGKNPKGARKVA